MNSLLSWDDMEEDLPIKSAVNQSAALKAAESLKNLDTTEAEKELDEQGKSIELNKQLKEAGLSNPVNQHSPLFTPGVAQSSESLKQASDRMQIATAKQVARSASGLVETPEQTGILNHDLAMRVIKSLAYARDAFERGEAPKVDDKMLLNCSSDLSQLVPFKYPAFWSLYLTSCECHWMPAELGMEKDVGTFRANKNITQHKFLSRFYNAYMFRIRDFSSETLLNIYRQITNPECRQYILRQAFENAAITHAMTDLKEIFDPNNLIIDGQNISKAQWDRDRAVFIARSRLVKELTPNLHDFDAVTTGLENTSNFIEQLLYMYSYTNWTMMITPIYQLMSAIPEAQGLNKLCVSLLRDMQNQLSFITSFMQDVMQENPQVLTAEFSQRVTENFLKMYNNEVILASSCPEHQEATNLVKHYMVKFLNDCGIPHGIPTTNLPTNVHGFLQLVDSLQPKVNHEAGLGGNGGSLGW